MSKKTEEKSSVEEEKSSDDDETKFLHSGHATQETLGQEHFHHESSEVGPHHGEDTSFVGEEFSHQSLGLRTRGPGRPRIHPLKPSGIGRPRGRPKGSKNKKPRKRLEKPPKRPRGRPRKWPPEMWEGFQRTRQAVVHQRLQHQQTILQQEVSGTSSIYQEQAEGSSMHSIASTSHHPMQHLHPPHLQNPSLHSQHMQQYAQMSSDASQPPGPSLMIQHPGLSSSTHQPMMPMAVLPEREPHLQERLDEEEGLLWMHHLPPEEQHPPTTSR